METRSERRLRGESHAAAPTELRALWVEYDRASRMRRAGRSALPLLAGAVVSLPIPAWHLVAVPGFLIAAVFFAVRRLREHERIESIDGPCPACGDPQPLPPPTPPAFPVLVRCPGCGEFVKLHAD